MKQVCPLLFFPLFSRIDGSNGLVHLGPSWLLVYDVVVVVGGDGGGSRCARG